MGPGVQLARIRVRVRRWTPVGTPMPFPTYTLLPCASQAINPALNYFSGWVMTSSAVRDIAVDTSS